MRTTGSATAICIADWTGDFAEDKDAAATLREDQIRRTLADDGRIVLDFSGVRLATQSFIHALISDVLRANGEVVLDRITFKNCSKAVKGIIETVVQYSLESIEPDAPTTSADEQTKVSATSKKRK